MWYSVTGKIKILNNVLIVMYTDCRTKILGCSKCFEIYIKIETYEEKNYRVI